jgi:hypothetical protein
MTLPVIDRSTGEIVSALDAWTLIGTFPIADRATSELARFTEDAAELRRVAAEAIGIVSEELVARLDADASWTLRVEDWEIKAPSPAAGTVTYDVDLLREALDELVSAGVISRDGAWNALEPVRATIEVSYRLLRDALRALDGYDVAEPVFNEIQDILLGEPAPTYRLKVAGVNALLKIPNAREAIESCRLSVTPPRRTAKVKRVSP